MKYTCLLTSSISSPLLILIAVGLSCSEKTGSWSHCSAEQFKSPLACKVAAAQSLGETSQRRISCWSIYCFLLKVEARWEIGLLRAFMTHSHLSEIQSSVSLCCDGDSFSLLFRRLLGWIRSGIDRRSESHRSGE